MSVKPDDFSVGHYYAIKRGATIRGVSMFGEYEKEDESMNGMPFKVLHICLPFLFIEIGIGEKTIGKSLDCLSVEIVKVDEQYFKLYWSAATNALEHNPFHFTLSTK